MILKLAQISLLKPLIFFKKAVEVALDFSTNILEAGYLLLQIIACMQTTSVDFPGLDISCLSLLIQLANQAPLTVGD